MMNIEWDDAPAPRGRQTSDRVKGLWSKLKNSISVIKPEPGSHPPTPTRRSSTSAGKSSSSPHHGTPSSSRPPSHSRAAKRPTVTINGQVITPTHRGNNQYTYVAYRPPPLSPSPASPRSPTGSGAPTPVRRTSVPRYNSPQSPQSPHHRSHPPTPPARRPLQRSASTPSGGVMYNGKLIVGPPAEVERYINSQKSVEKWARNVKK